MIDLIDKVLIPAKIEAENDATRFVNVMSGFINNCIIGKKVKSDGSLPKRIQNEIDNTFLLTMEAYGFSRAWIRAIDGRVVVQCGRRINAFNGEDSVQHNEYYVSEKCVAFVVSQVIEPTLDKMKIFEEKDVLDVYDKIEQLDMEIYTRKMQMNSLMRVYPFLDRG